MQVAVCAVAALLRMLLSLSPSAFAQLTPITNGNIKSAVSEWTTNSTAATAKYGDIGGWNVAAVASMGNLFYTKRGFNADLGRWNVASVIDMATVCSSESKSLAPREGAGLSASSNETTAEASCTRIPSANIRPLCSVFVPLCEHLC